MANYNVGNIEIGIISSPGKTLSSFDKVIDRLQEFKKIDKNLQNIFFRINQLGNGLRRIENIDVSSLDGQIEGISKATGQLVSKLQSIEQPNFDKTAKALNQISNAFRQFNKLGDLEFENIKKVFSNLTIAIDPFLNKLKESEASLVSLSSILKNLKSRTITKAGQELDKAKTKTDKWRNSISKTGNSIKKSFNLTANLGKLYFIMNYSKRFISGLKNIVSYASDYTEILNKFKVSFGDLYDENLKSTTQLADAFGFSSNTLLDYTSTFNNMLKSLKGLEHETSASISQTLTRMAIDYSSIFNVSIDKAMKSFQSALSGNVRSLRDVSGFDTSETTIFSVYQQLGGTKTMRQLNQLEKRLLRIIAIQQQMQETGAMGDYARTIETVSNQIKIMQETLIEVGKYIGQNILVYLKPLIQYANGVLLTLKEIFKTLSLTREEVDNIDYETEFAGFGQSVEDTTEAVEELNEQMGILLGFDKLNILGSSSATSVGNVEGLSVEGSILDALKEYNINLDKVKFKAQDISQRLLTWAGFVYDADNQVWKFAQSFENVSDVLNYVWSKINDISTILSTKFKEAFKDVLTYIRDNGETIFTSFVENGINTLSMWLSDSDEIIELVLQVIDTIVQTLQHNAPTIIKAVLELVKAVISYLPNIIENSLENTDVIIDILTDVATTIIEELPHILSMIIAQLPSILVSSIENTPEILASVVNLFISLLESVYNALLQFWYGLLSGSVLNEDSFKKIGEAFKGIGDKFKEEFADIGEWFEDTFTLISQAFKTIWNGVKTWFQDNFVKPIGNFFINIINGVIDTLNKLSFDVPDWIPGIGGKTFGFNIDKIPALANGGVITQPTTALVGEYAGAKTNPEIVTPENLMREVFIESMLPIAQAIISGDREVVSAINDLANRPVELNGRKVSENIYNDLQKVALRKGQVMFANAR